MSTVNGSGDQARVRWEQQSTTYKKENRAVQFKATALASAGIALVGKGLVTDKQQLMAGLAYLIAGIAIVLLSPLFWLIRAQGEWGLYKDYHKESQARVICQHLRDTYRELPDASPNDKMRRALHNRVKELSRYGFINGANASELLHLLDSEGKDRRSIDQLATQPPTPDYEARKKTLEQQVENTKLQWRKAMDKQVFPDLPF